MLFLEITRALMHELSIAQNVVEIVRQYVPNDALAGVRSVRLRVGRLSGVVPESLEFSFNAIVSGTPLESALLNIELVPTLCQCASCEGSFEASDFVFLCPSCGGSDIKIISGSDLHVVDIELEETDVHKP